MGSPLNRHPARKTERGTEEGGQAAQRCRGHVRSLLQQTITPWKTSLSFSRVNQHVRWALLAQCAFNTGAQVPRARLFHSSLIIPSSEISGDHYFLHDFEMLLMTMEIIICYKVLLHLEGFYSPVLFLLAALWRWVKLPSLQHRWEDRAGGLHSWARGPRWGGPKPGLGLCGPLLSGETCICRSVSCGHGGGQQAIQGRCSLCSCWGSPPNLWWRSGGFWIFPPDLMAVRALCCQTEG